jgi:hypothetical protein
MKLTSVKFRKNVFAHLGVGKICLEDGTDFQPGEVILANQLPKGGSIKKTRNNRCWLHQSGPWQHKEGRSNLTTSSCKVLKRMQTLLSSNRRSISMGEMELALTIRMQV